MENTIKHCITHYDNITIKEPLTALTIATLKSLQKIEKSDKS